MGAGLVPILSAALAGAHFARGAKRQLSRRQRFYHSWG